MLEYITTDDGDARAHMEAALGTLLHFTREDNERVAEHRRAVEAGVVQRVGQSVLSSTFGDWFTGPSQ